MAISLDLIDQMIELEEALADRLRWPSGTMSMRKTSSGQPDPRTIAREVSVTRIDALRSIKGRLAAAEQPFSNNHTDDRDAQMEQ